MPTYDYQCENCGNFEFYQGMKDAALTKCPKCGGKAERLFSQNVNFLFKGNGFYITDYRSDEYKKKASEEKKIATSASASNPSPAPSASAASSGSNTISNTPSPSGSGQQAQ